LLGELARLYWGNQNGVAFTPEVAQLQLGDLALKRIPSRVICGSSGHPCQVVYV
jgi:hypothetical protein